MTSPADSHGPASGPAATPPPRAERQPPLAVSPIDRFFGGSPLAVLARLILLSILVGVVLAAFGFDPWNLWWSVRFLIERIWAMGFEAVEWVWRYFLLGAVIVVPLWLLSRLFNAPRGR